MIHILAPTDLFSTILIANIRRQFIVTSNEWEMHYILLSASIASWSKGTSRNLGHVLTPLFLIRAFHSQNRYDFGTRLSRCPTYRVRKDERNQYLARVTLLHCRLICEGNRHRRFWEKDGLDTLTRWSVSAIVNREQTMFQFPVRPNQSGQGKNYI